MNDWTKTSQTLTTASVNASILPVYCNMVQVTLTPQGTQFTDDEMIEATLVSLTTRGKVCCHTNPFLTYQDFQCLKFII